MFSTTTKRGFIVYNKNYFSSQGEGGQDISHFLTENYEGEMFLNPSILSENTIKTGWATHTKL